MNASRKPSVQAQLKQQLQRLNALSARERLVIFLSLVAAMLALVDFVWLTPAQQDHARLVQHFTAQNTELLRLRAELQTLAQAPDATREARANQQRMDARAQELRAHIETLAPRLGSAAALEQALVQMARQFPGLQLVTLRTREGAAPREGALADASPQAPGLQQRALEVRVRGPYADLQRYTHMLEQNLPELRWTTLTLQSDTQPPEMHLQLYVVGVQP